MSGQVCFPEPRSQHSKSAIGNGTIARLHLFRTIFFRRHEHGQHVEPSFVWANDSWIFYYVRKHPVTLLPYQVWRHAIGTPASQDKLIYEEKDDTYYVSLHKTTSTWSSPR